METLLNPNGPLRRQPFILRSLGIVIVGILVSIGVYEAGYHMLHFKPVGVFFVLVTWVFFGTALFIQVMRRMQDLGKPSITFFIPIYNLYLLALILFAPGKEKPEG